MTDTLFDLADVDASAPPDPNPCRRLYGPGPDGKTCAGCRLLANHGGGGYRERRYWKCTLRKVTSGPATDHRRGWLACGCYTEAAQVCCECGSAKGVKFSERDGRPYCLECWRKTGR